MKQLYNKLCLAALLLPTLTIIADCSSSCSTSANVCDSTLSYFSPRSQSVDLSRQFVGVLGIMDELTCSDECWPGFVSVTAEFEKTFNSKQISRCLFGPALSNNGNCQSINISGSTALNRGPNDFLADNFGLPTDFQSVVNLDPQVTSFIGDIQGYFRLDRWLCGLYFYIHAPITGTKWNLHVCEDIGNPGGAGYPAGYFGPGAIGQENLLHSFSDFISGRATSDLSGTTPLGASFTETFNTLQYSRWATAPCDSLTKSGLADLRMWLGYDWLNCERYGFGIGAVIAAPTGNRPNARYLFEPIIGNGRHWELGVLIKGDYMLWRDCDDTNHLNLFSQANITHLFNSKQRRTFDLTGKPLSRYMLAERLTANNSSPFLYGNPMPNITAGSNLSDFKFAGEFTSVANLTTLCVDVSTNVQIDWVTMLTYSRRNFSADLGYELWYRGCEKIKTDCDTTGLIAANTWALKGDASVFGFAHAANSNLPILKGQPVALGATESSATIFKGTNQGLTNASTNPDIDNPQYAVAANLASAPTQFALLDSDNLNNLQTRTSIQSIFLSGDDINICGAGSKGFTNKVFANISYSWDCTCWQPFLGVGAMGEFATRENCKTDCNTTSNCDNDNGCTRCAFSQWGLWIKGGFVF